MDSKFTKDLIEIQRSILWIKKYQVHTALQYQMNAKDAFSSTSWLGPSVDITQLWKNNILLRREKQKEYFK